MTHEEVLNTILAHEALNAILAHEVPLEEFVDDSGKVELIFNLYSDDMEYMIHVNVVEGTNGPEYQAIKITSKFRD